MITITTGYRPLTQAEWRESMLNEVAYIKPVLDNGRRSFSIHAADGTKLAVIADRYTALAAVLEHDLELVSVH